MVTLEITTATLLVEYFPKATAFAYGIDIVCTSIWYVSNKQAKLSLMAKT
jgi:hypothetical protein